MFPDAMATMGQLGLLVTGSDAPKSFMDTLPDPMKLDGATFLFVIVLVTSLFVFMKYVFFKPIVRIMDDRDAAIRSGAEKRTEAAALIEARQADYAARLRELRAKAFEHRKGLSAAAIQAKQALVEQARQEANGQRLIALTELKAAQEAAKAELMTQVETLSESMVQHLLRQA